GEQPYGVFSNYYYPIKLKVRIPRELASNGQVVSEKGFLTEELEFSSSEALFHALKFTQKDKERLDIINQIKNLDPENSKKTAGQHDKKDYDTEN
ncbi:27215_t:CDS:1, partial [Racocetra persica]